VSAPEPLGEVAGRFFLLLDKLLDLLRSARGGWHPVRRSDHRRRRGRARGGRRCRGRGGRGRGSGGCRRRGGLRHRRGGGTVDRHGDLRGLGGGSGGGLRALGAARDGREGDPERQRGCAGELRLTRDASRGGRPGRDRRKTEGARRLGYQDMTTAGGTGGERLHPPSVEQPPQKRSTGPPRRRFGEERRIRPAMPC
jgi:hypothetical protein